MAPTVGQVAAACHGEVIAGDAELLGREALHLIGGGDDAAEPDGADHRRRGADHARRPRRGAAGGDVRARVDRAPLPRGRRADRRAAAAGEDPRAAGQLRRRSPRCADRARHVRDGRRWRARARARSRRDAPRKITKALALFETHVDGDDLLDRIDVARSEAVTPLMFEYTLLDRARAAAQAHRAARGDRRAGAAGGRHPAAPARGRADAARARGRGARRRRRGSGWTCTARTCSTRPTRSCVERFAAEYAARRAHKGVTVDAARDVVTDVSYFGTMMVALGHGRRDGLAAPRTRPRRRSGRRSSWSRRARTSRSCRACS